MQTDLPKIAQNVGGVRPAKTNMLRNINRFLKNSHGRGFAQGLRGPIQTARGHIGASLLSFVPTYMTKDHHQKDGKCFGGKEPIDFVTRTEATGVSRLSGGDFFEPRR